MNLTEDAPVKFVPVIATDVPTGPETGVNEAIVGGEDEITVKFAALVAVPLLVVTVILPVVAPAGTVAVIWVSESMLPEAVTPLNLRPVVVAKPVPVMTTVSPTCPEVGENDVIVGPEPNTVKLAELVAVPAEVVTVILPVVAPVGTVVVIWVSESMLPVAATPLKARPVVVAKPVPVIVTVAPTAPEVGENEVIVGPVEVSVKLELLVAVPLGVVSVIGPVPAPVGAWQVTWVSVLKVNVAVTPLNLTEVVPVKPVPVSVTVVPTGPCVGVNEVIVGGTFSVKLELLVAVPPGVVTEIGPVPAPVGAWQVICVAELVV